MLRVAFIVAALLVAAESTFAVAQIPTKDAPLGAYVRYGANSANIRVDKIERVDHVDNNVLVKNVDQGDGTTGYLIFSLSVQNAGPSDNFAPSFRVTEFLDDQSKIENDIQGPFVGAARADAPDRLHSKESIKIRFVQVGIPADRKVTKIVFDPNDGGPMLRFQIKPSDIVPLAEIPRPKPTD